MAELEKMGEKYRIALKYRHPVTVELPETHVLNAYRARTRAHMQMTVL